MARISFEYPVKDVCGKIGKDTAVGFAHRGSTKFSVKYGKRSTPVSESEISHRQKFARVCNATCARMTDPEQALTDQIGFAGQNKYKTLYHYVFRQEWDKE